MKRKPKFKVGQVVKDAMHNCHPRRVCEIRNGLYYCIPGIALPDGIGNISTRHWFNEKELRPLTKREKGTSK